MSSTVAARRPMAVKKQVVVHKPHYEFGGPLGAFGISFGLPLVCYMTTLLCNDLTGCPVPSVLTPSTLTLDKLRYETGWPGMSGLYSNEVTGMVLLYYLTSAVLHAVLPGEHKLGTKLASGGQLKYKLNTFSSSAFTVGLCLVGTYVYGAEFALWTYIWDNYLQILTANVCISYLLATFVYVRSFNVKPGNPQHRELAAGGLSGNMLYDWYIGRELNPRISLPLIGEIDIKEFMELRPGMLGWCLLDMAFVAHQYRSYGYISDSIILVTAFHTLYIFDSYWMESAVLTTMDITTDGFGFMLAFGDLVWVPFVYSIQARYLAVYPTSLGPYGSLAVLAVLATGYYIFRSSNNEKNRFRSNPDDPWVAHLKYIETTSGSRLITSGWWGTARHINYFGDWIQAWAYCLPTGIAGYVIEYSSQAPGLGQSPLDGSSATGRTGIATVNQGPARGYGMAITYFYLVYFTVLLIHREMRDEEKCIKKYGDDWKRYTKLVPYRIIPGIY